MQVAILYQPSLLLRFELHNSQLLVYTCSPSLPSCVPSSFPFSTLLSHTPFFFKPFGTEILLASMETCHHLPDSLVDLEFKALEARQQVLTAHTPFHNGIPDRHLGIAACLLALPVTERGPISCVRAETEIAQSQEAQTFPSSPGVGDNFYSFLNFSLSFFFQICLSN